jgi:CheY-like chemotaxis protein
MPSRSPDRASDRAAAVESHADDADDRPSDLVLLVEDDEDLRKMMVQLLALEGFRVAAVANGREALDYLNDYERPSLILLDLMMPVMDGWEFRQRLGDNPAVADVPVVVLSSLDPDRSAEIAPDTVLKKPVDVYDLLDLVRRYCK